MPRQALSIVAENRVRLVHPFLAAMVLAATVQACGAPPPEPPPPPPPATMVDLTLTAKPEVNPDESGRPSPVVVRIYQLAAGGAFEGADFFQLYRSDATTLRQDLLHRDEVVLSPGETRTLRFEPKPATQAVGVMALFRRIDQAAWRGLANVPPHETTAIGITLDGVTLSLIATAAR
jgi:type VI secretion system protein VasD